MQRRRWQCSSRTAVVARQGGGRETHRWKYTVYCVVTIRGRMSGQRVAAFPPALSFRRIYLQRSRVLNTGPLARFTRRMLEIRTEWGQLFSTATVESATTAGESTRAPWLAKKPEAELWTWRYATRFFLYLFYTQREWKNQYFYYWKHFPRSFYLLKAIATDCFCKLNS